jgi:hypothetical protein
MMFAKRNNRKGNTMVMALAIVVVFSTISIAFNELIVMQATETEYIGAQTQLEYAAYAGLVHGEVSLTEDLGTVLTDVNVTLADYRKQYCVAWGNAPGASPPRIICNPLARPNEPWCNKQKHIGNQRGVCTYDTYWRSVYHSSYDSISKSIISSAAVYMMSIDEDNPFSSMDNISFKMKKEMVLTWE